ncbi:MAG: sugar phosphate isomerase/epimerase [Bacteroidales bacterium]|jgi:sugar phosphate isomerase/epimerase|nr:sugar phosphate isomerase/epimerase [Bacteroidales bacterium]
MNRRNFSKTAALSAIALNAFPLSSSALDFKNEASAPAKVPLGLCNHSLRGMKLEAKQLIEYAIEHQLDSVQFNTLTVFESLEEDHLAELHKLAKANGISIYVGAGSISESSAKFSDRYGDAKALISEGIRVAKAVNSPIVGVRIGNIDDRYTNGGIKPKIDEVVKVMKSMRGPALDAGIKFAFENHAGDLRSSELLDLIEEVGSDICGAFYDPGNAIWAMEDPMLALEVLGKHIVCTSVRDVMVWESEDGATFQWTAIGEGLMDYKYYTKYLSENCPGVPLHVESISNAARPIPFLKAEFWDGFPDLPAKDISDFLKLVRKGHPLDIASPLPGTDKKVFEKEHQESEFLKSINYLRLECGAGIKKMNLFLV